LKFVEGWFIPDVMKAPGSWISRTNGSALEQYSGEVAVQAGGHIGMYPKRLSERFARVYTFEPDATNFECLTANCAGRQGVWAARGVLGDARGCVGVNRHKNSGGHSVDGEGATPLYRIDDLSLDACDLIYLDVEGYEVHALRGALKTIRAYKPVIVAEENKQQQRHGFKPGDIEKLLAPLGYRKVRSSGEDIVLECR
jgi:FkbM family methyltransferase